MSRSKILITLAATTMLFCGSVLSAQDVDPKIDPGQSPNAPAAPTSPSERAIAEAIVELEAELAALEQQWAAENRALETQIAERSDEVTRLASEELTLRKSFGALADTLYEADQARIEAEVALGSVEGGYEALWGELARQANELRDRFGNSFLSSEDPAFLTPLASIAMPDDPAKGDFDRSLESLLTAYDHVLDAAEQAGTFKTAIAHTASGGVIAEGTVLRLGLFGAYYSTPLESGRESGFLSAPVEVGATPEGKAIGLSPDQMSAIAALVENPSHGGFVPVDVTGGASLAALEVGDSPLEWFEKGGVFMWPIAFVAVLALLISLERAIALLLKTRGIDAGIHRVLEKIEGGRTQEALTASQLTRGPVGRVLESALVHADRDRSVMEDAVQESLLHVQPQLTTRLSFIALCAAVAPLMGLLGTVTGMIETFTQVTIFGTSDPRNMAGGISVALITTQAGLYLAIPCLLARGILGSFADSALGKIETGAMSVVLTILEARDPMDEAAPAASAWESSDDGIATEDMATDDIAEDEVALEVDETPKKGSARKSEELASDRSARLGDESFEGDDEFDLDDVEPSSSGTAKR
ncbi:MAG: MotA/TolQ/ExbB proton channel family protein [Planctomycetota bacterium]